MARPTRDALLALLVFITLVPYLRPLTTIADRPVATAFWAVLGLSMGLNVVTLGYHARYPPHPKFVIVGWRRVMLRVHIGGGVVELLAGGVAVLTGHPGAALVMALAALVVQVPTALAQTNGVFGSRAIMRPAYLACSGIHAFCAGMLLVHPTSTYWVVSTLSVLHIYVWTRVYYFLFERSGAFRGSRYSVSILLAGMTALPVVLGAATPLAVATAIAAYTAACTLLFVRSRAELHELVRERSRHVAFEDDAGLLEEMRAAHSERDKAELVFRRLDLDGDGLLGPVEIGALLDRWAMPPAETARWLRAIGAVRIDFGRFFEDLRPVWRFVFYEIMESQTGGRPDILVRAMAAHDAAATTRRVRRELAGRLRATETLLDQLAQSVVEEEYPVGSRLMDGGTPDGRWWLIRSGRLSVSREGEPIAVLGAGDWVGDPTDAPGSTTVEVTVHAHVYAVSRPSMTYLVGKHPELSHCLNPPPEVR